MNILTELWYGNINPTEQEAYWTEECKALWKRYEHNSDKLTATLNADEKETLENIHNCWMELQQYNECSAFIIGFRLAVQLMAASLHN